jgi:hypothetical protein
LAGTWKQYSKKRDAPAHQDHEQQGVLSFEFQMPIPRERHENVRAGQQHNGQASGLGQVIHNLGKGILYLARIRSKTLRAGSPLPAFISSKPRWMLVHGINQIIRARIARFQYADVFADGMIFCFTQSQLHVVKNEFAGQRCQMGTRKISRNLFEVAERRPKIANGETVGIHAQTNKAPDGAKENSVGDFLPPLFAGRGKAVEGHRSPGRCRVF